MQVVINAGFLSNLYSGEYINFLSQAFRHISKNHPEHHFIFICERQSTDLFAVGDNVKLHIIKSGNRNLFMRKYWYDVRIPVILRKYKADVFLSPGNCCSLRTKVPQCMIIHGLDFLYAPPVLTKTQSFFYKTYSKKIINKAKIVITLSAFTSNEIIKKYGITATKIDKIYNCTDKIFKPVDDQVQQTVKTKYTEGKEYFLYKGGSHSEKKLTDILKSFSLFKKRQQSNLKIIFCGDGISADASFKKSLKTYKYKSDVVIVDEVDKQELVKLVSAAYALIYTGRGDDFYTPVKQAMQCKVPVISFAGQAAEEITGGAALYVKPDNIQDMADGMMRLYKDEKKRNELINNAAGIVQRFTPDETASLLWQSIQKTFL